MEERIVHKFQLTCQDLGWDADVILEIVTWILEEKRYYLLAPNKEEWNNLRRQRELIEIMSQKIEDRIKRHWTHDEIKNFIQRIETEYNKPVRQPISFETELHLLFNKEQTCAICGASGPDMLPEIDHRIPASKGGSPKYPNLQWMCRKHNRQKSNKIGKEWKNA